MGGSLAFIKHVTTNLILFSILKYHVPEKSGSILNPPSPHTLRIVLRLQLPEPRKIDIEDIFCTFVAPSHIQLNTKRAILVMDVVRNLFDKSRSGRIRRRLSISDSGRQ